MKLPNKEFEKRFETIEFPGKDGLTKTQRKEAKKWGEKLAKESVNIIKKHLDNTKTLAQLLFDYYEASRNYYACQIMKNVILRPKKDREQQLEWGKRMIDLGMEMNKLAEKIDKMFGK